MAENPSTGFRWHLADWDRSIVDLTRDEFQPPGGGRAGEGGAHLWEFVARSPGKSSLRLASRRSWESADPVKVFSLDVSIH